MLARPALDTDRIHAVAGPGWQVEVVQTTTSTNAALLAVPGVPDRCVLVAEEQTAGRGRLDRTWSSPPRSGLTFSVALRPIVPVQYWSWLPLLGGVATVEAVRTLFGVDASLKWPNDVLVGAAKLAGILAQSDGELAVMGIGLNVSLTHDELPVATATSLHLAGATGPLDRSALLGAILGRLDHWLERWYAAAGDAAASGLASAYRAMCATLGSDVRIDLGNGQSVEGTATDVDISGRIVVTTADGPRAIGAGDVEHLRPSR